MRATSGLLSLVQLLRSQLTIYYPSPQTRHALHKPAFQPLFMASTAASDGGQAPVVQDITSADGDPAKGAEAIAAGVEMETETVEAPANASPPQVAAGQEGTIGRKLILENMPKFWDDKKTKRMLRELEIDGVVKVKKVRKIFKATVVFDSLEARQKAKEALEGHTVEERQLHAVFQEDKLDARDSRPPGKRQKVEAVEDNRTINQVVTAWYGVHTYEEQLAKKEAEMNEECYTKTMKLLVKEYNKRAKTQKRQEIADGKESSRDMSMPAWLQGKKSDPLPFEVGPILPSPAVMGYRNKCEFTCGVSRSGDPEVGFRFGSFRLGNLSVDAPDDCPHVSDSMKRVVKEFKEVMVSSGLPPYSFEDNSGVWRTLMLRHSLATQEVMVVVIVTLAGVDREVWLAQQKKLLEKLTDGASCEKVVSLYLMEYDGVSDHPVSLLWGKETFEEKLLDCNFRISPGAFFQTNTLAAEVLYTKVIEEVKRGRKDGEGGDGTLLDVCCGTGTIGLCCAKAGACARVVGVDLCEPAIEDAIVNAKANGIDNSSFLCSRAEAAMAGVVGGLAPGEREKELSCVVDPPREGLHSKVIIAIRGCEQIKRLVYVSCNPAKSLPRDAVFLCQPESNRYQGNAFRIVRANPVDLFPHTPHCEMVMVFERD